MPAARTVTLSVCLVIGAGLLTSCTGAGGAGTGPQSPSSTAAGSETASSPSNAACSGRTVSLGPLLRRTVITEISDITHVGSGGGSFIAKLRPVRTVVPAVEGAGVVDPTSVYAEFAQKAGAGIAQIGEEPPHDDVSGQVVGLRCWRDGGVHIGPDHGNKLHRAMRRRRHQRCREFLGTTTNRHHAVRPEAAKD